MMQGNRQAAAAAAPAPGSSFGAATRGLVRPVIASSVLFMLVTGIAYPLLTTGVANVLFPSQARGSLVQQHGTTVGSAVIGQQFTRAGYFHGRPSATVGTDPADPSKTVDQPYNAAGSGASQGATSRSCSRISRCGCAPTGRRTSRRRHAGAGGCGDRVAKPIPRSRSRTRGCRRRGSRRRAASMPHRLRRWSTGSRCRASSACSANRACACST